MVLTKTQLYQLQIYGTIDIKGTNRKNSTIYEVYVQEIMDVYLYEDEGRYIESNHLHS